MLIIVEGPKCSGKSTLCAKIQEEIGGTIIHFPTDPKLLLLLGRPECQDLMRQDIDQTISAIIDLDEIYILDRSFISNAVYRDDLSILADYQDILAKSMVIILDYPDDVLIDRMNNRTEKPFTAFEREKLEWSNSQFKKVDKLLNCSTYPIPGYTKTGNVSWS